MFNKNNLPFVVLLMGYPDSLPGMYRFSLRVSIGMYNRQETSHKTYDSAEAFMDSPEFIQMRRVFIELVNADFDMMCSAVDIGRQLVQISEKRKS